MLEGRKGGRIDGWKKGREGRKEGLTEGREEGLIDGRKEGIDAQIFLNEFTLPPNWTSFTFTRIEPHEI